MISKEDMGALVANDGDIISLDGEQVPVGPGFDYAELSDVFDDLIETRGVEGTAKALGYKDGKELIQELAEMIYNGQDTIDDLIYDCCDGHPADDIDYEADAADHKADELAGR